MKKLIFVCAALALSFSTYAQTDTSMNKMNHSHMGMTKKDGIMMMGGKMMIVKNGKMSDMKKEMTMTNGTKVMADGMCMKKDGTRMTMKEGDHMDMSGKMMPMKEGK